MTVRKTAKEGLSRVRVTGDGELEVDTRVKSTVAVKMILKSLATVGQIITVPG